MCACSLSQIDLPMYSSADICKQRLLTALNFGMGSFNEA